jgi:hypothetical protein
VTTRKVREGLKCPDCSAQQASENLGAKGQGVIRAFHFTADTLRDGRPIPTVGEWIEHVGPIVPCQSGLHASIDPLDALQYAPGPMLHLVDLDGEILEHGTPPDKLVGRRRRIVASIDATDLLREFARWCALQVVHLWQCPDVVRRYLETGDESIRGAARDAAWDAARAAARAAWDSAWASAWASARASARASTKDAQRAKFSEVVNTAFNEVNP